MRVRARTEHKATPITMTTMMIGLRSAARRSHMAMALLVFCHGVTAGKALGRLGRRQLKRDSAKQPAAPERRQSPLARENFARRKRQRESRARLDNERAPGFPLKSRSFEFERRVFCDFSGAIE